MNNHLFSCKAFYLYLVCFLFLTVLSGWSIAEEAAENLGENQVTAQADNKAEGLYASPEAVEKWKDLKFGIMITWTPASLMGTEASWSRQGDGSGLRGPKGPIPPDVYDSLYRSFYPGQFDAREWVELFQDAGAKYIVFITKHHDGFCFFHSQYTGYDMTAAPFKRDIVRELADACHNAGMGLGLYYSHWDWCHPFYRNEHHVDYIDYMQKQLDELTRNYGPVMELWFDGRGPAELWDAEETVRLIRRNQPGIMVNERLGISVDYQTSEGAVGTFNNEFPWEAALTMAGQWAWKFDAAIRSLNDCISMLVLSAGGDGNLLLNVGPMPTGQFAPNQAQRLREIGQWLNEYGESIYATRGGPFKPGFWGASTHKNNIVYLHILRWDMFGSVLPLREDLVRSCRILHGPEVRMQKHEKGIRLDIPPDRRVEPVTVIQLELNEPANTLPVQVLADRGLTAQRVTAGSQWREPGYEAEKASDGDVATEWWAAAPISESWLEFDFDTPVTVNGVRIYEDRGRVRSWKLLYRQNGAWQEILSGTFLGPNMEKDFNAVTSDSFRLQMDSISHTVRIREVLFKTPELRQ